MKPISQSAKKKKKKKIAVKTPKSLSWSDLSYYSRSILIWNNEKRRICSFLEQRVSHQRSSADETGEKKSPVQSTLADLFHNDLQPSNSMLGTATLAFRCATIKRIPVPSSSFYQFLFIWFPPPPPPPSFFTNSLLEVKRKNPPVSCCRFD